MEYEVMKCLAEKYLATQKKRREYQNAWRKRNKDKVIKYNEQYQRRKTLKKLAEKGGIDNV